MTGPVFTGPVVFSGRRRLLEAREGEEPDEAGECRGVAFELDHTGGKRLGG